MTTAIYARLSKNRDGKAESVPRQLANARAYAEAKFPGSPIVEYKDDGITAADDRVYRPGFEYLKADIAAGIITNVVCRDQDRISRTEEWFKFQALLLAADIPELHTYADGVILVDSDVADIKAVLSKREAMKARKRTNEALEALARDGRPTGGRSFGYRHDVNGAGQKVLRLVPDEAAIARECAELLLAGWSLTSVAHKLNDDGVATVRGSTWTATNLHRILTAPIITGQRVYRGEVVGDISPDYLDEPVLDRATYQTLRAVLAERGKHRSTKAPKQRPGAQKYLLVGGILRCGRCEAVMRSHKRRNKRTGEMIARYVCDGTRGGCGRIAAKAEPVEAYVVDRLLLRLQDTDDLREDDSEHEAQRESLHRQIKALQLRKSELVAMWTRNAIDSDEWQAGKQAAEEQLQVLNAELAAIPASISIDPLYEGDDSEERWEAATIEERRHVLASKVAKVVIMPGVSGSHRFDEARVRIYGHDGVEWKRRGI